MRSRIRSTSFRTVLSALLIAWLPACGDDTTGPDVSAREVGVVVNSIDVSLTVFDVDDPTITETIGLGADGSPVSLALRGGYGVVPLGIVPAVAIVDLSSAELIRTVGLPEGSGATGVAFLNDSIALVANPDLGSITPVNVRAGTAGSEIEVGRYPQSIVVEGGRVYVVNAELENFAPDGPSTITVLNATTLAVLDTIELSGENGGASVMGPDGRLYVLHSGSWGAANGAISVIDLATGTEVDFAEGFGNFPGSLAVDDAGRVYVGAFGVGMLVWNPATGSFSRGPDDAVTPGGFASTSGIGVDSEGRVYALMGECQNPAAAHRLNADYESESTISVGTCPADIAFAEVDGGS